MGLYLDPPRAVPPTRRTTGDWIPPGRKWVSLRRRRQMLRTLAQITASVRRDHPHR